MAQSSGCFASGLEWRPGMENGPEDVHAPACESDDCLVVAFSFAPLAFVERPAVVMGEGAECRLVEDAFEPSVAAAGSSEEACSAGLAQHGCNSSSRSECVGGSEAGEVACLSDQFCGEDGSHAGQAADEGRIGVPLKQGFQFAVEVDQARSAGLCLDGEFTDQAGGHALGWDDDDLLGGDGQDTVGQVFDFWQATGRLQVSHGALLACCAQFGWGDEFGQQVEWPLGFEVEASFQARKDSDKEVAHPGQPLGLCLDDVAAAADQQPDLKVQFGCRLDRTQIGSRANLVGDGAGISRVGLVLTTNGSLAGAVDGDARHMDEGEPGLSQHSFSQACDSADDIHADAHRAAHGGQFVGLRCDVGWGVEQLAVDPRDAIGINGSDPVYLRRNVDPDADPHGAPWKLVSRHSAQAVFALRSDESQSLISGRGGVAVPGDLLSEPSWAASLKTIPTPPPRRDPGMPGSRRQALFSQHLNGRAA